MMRVFALLSVLVVFVLAEDGLEFNPNKDSPETYFWNEITGESTWERPVEMGHTSTEPEHDGQKYWIVHGESTWEPAAEWDWHIHFDEESQREFYRNDRLGSSVWEKPRCLGWKELRTDDNSEVASL